MYISKVFQSKYYFFVLINDEEIRRYKFLKTLICCMARRLEIGLEQCSKIVNDLLLKENGDFSNQPLYTHEKIKLRKLKKKVPIEPNTKKSLVQLDIKAYLKHKGRDYLEMAHNQIGLLLTYEIFADLRFRELMTPQNYMEVIVKAKEAIEDLPCEEKEKVINNLALECIPIEGLTRFDYSPCKLFIHHLLTMVGFLEFA